MIWKFKYYDVNAGPDWVGLEKDCEWFRDMADTPQDHIWHAEGNVQIHTKMVCEALFKHPEFIALDEQTKHIMFTGALMHDIEKRSTTAEEERDGRICIVAPKHARKGEYTARLLLYAEYECPFHIREQICKLVRYHGRPLYAIEEGSERDLVNLSYMISLNLLALIAKVDILGRTCQDADKQLEKIDFFEALAEELGCLHQPRIFPDLLSRFEYLSKGGYIDYVPFDDKKYTVTLLSGIAGAGKDTYYKKNLSHLPMVSLDNMREELDADPTDTKATGQIIQASKEKAKEYMRKGQDFVWNGTNITSQLRKQLIDLFLSYGGKVRIVYVEVPYKQLKSQNSSRESSVPNNIIDKMVRKLEPPVISECHEIIYP